VWLLGCLCAIINNQEMKSITCLTIFFILTSCNSATNLTKPGLESQRIAYLTDLIKKVGFLKLPISYDIEKADFESKYTTKENSIDTLFFKSANEIVCGFLPDTSRYYCILYYQIGDLDYPNLLTIDKRGAIIDRKGLCLNVCGPPVEVDSSINRFEIDKSLNIKSFFYCHGKVETNDSIPKQLEVSEKIDGTGNITKDGKIKLIERKY
jgi:hypothetical protein